MRVTSHHHDAEALQARLAARLAAGLSERAETLPPDIGERLRFAREQALARAHEARRPAPAGAAAVVAAGRGGAVLGAPPPWWQRLASALPLAVLVAGLLLIQHRVSVEQVHAAAEIDAVLLADDLPPDAYSDPGFGEFLKSPQP
jgi:hypothetical protein